MNGNSGIFAGCIDGTTWIRIEGKGSFKNSPDLKAFVSERVGSGMRRLVMDLAHCTGMDSTFMGTLACTASRLEDVEGCLLVVNAAGRNGELLRGLGLDEMFTVGEGTEHLEPGEAFACQEAAAGAAALPCSEVSKIERTGVCLEAHEALCRDDQNKSRFRDVIELMRGQLAGAGA